MCAAPNYIYTMFPIAGLLHPPQVPCSPCLHEKKLRCSAACALELKTRLDGWFIGMLQVASSFFFDVSTLYILSKLFCIYIYIVILYIVCV